jgi:signal peptidase I
MFTDRIEQIAPGKKRRKDTAAEAANVLESLITTFITALLLVAFVVQPFIIPTGSMAPTLKGAHYLLRCTQCGYKYDYTFDSRDYRNAPTGIFLGNVAPPNSRCPSCGNSESSGYPMPVSNGDRIIVLKCIYQFFEPKRWDVIVFKNPTDPTQNYIKRLIGLPEETVEIVDGDIYINGNIARKPEKLQEQIWVPLYDSDFVPVNPGTKRFNSHAWQEPFDNSQDEAWQTGTVFRLSSGANEIHSLPYSTSRGNDFKASYSYNNVTGQGNLPFCSDLMIRFYAERGAGEGIVGAELVKYGVSYRAWVDSEGRATIERVDGENERVLYAKQLRKPLSGKPILFEFANADHRLTLQFGKERMAVDLSAKDVGVIKRFIEPKVKIAGSGELRLSHIALFRDIHYTSANGPGPGTATEGNPFALGKHEFFVLGDNSPASADGRWWDVRGLGNRDETYTQGVVPRDYLVGKALFVFWPGGFKPFENSPIALVPNLGQMRIIHGGTDDGK